MKVRWANSWDRVKVLKKCGHTDIDMVEIKYPSTKEEAVAFLQSIDFANGNPEVQTAMDEAAGKRTPQPKLKKVKGPSMDALSAKAKAKVDEDRKAALAALDDAPF
jgi:hypothetical protein